MMLTSRRNITNTTRLPLILPNLGDTTQRQQLLQNTTHRPASSDSTQSIDNAYSLEHLFTALRRRIRRIVQTYNATSFYHALKMCARIFRSYASYNLNIIDEFARLLNKTTRDNKKLLTFIDQFRLQLSELRHCHSTFEAELLVTTLAIDFHENDSEQQRKHNLPSATGKFSPRSRFSKFRVQHIRQAIELKTQLKQTNEHLQTLLFDEFNANLSDLWDESEKYISTSIPFHDHHMSYVLRLIPDIALKFEYALQLCAKIFDLETTMLENIPPINQNNFPKTPPTMMTLTPRLDFNPQIQDIPQQHNPQIQNLPQQHNQQIHNVPQQHNQQIQNVPQQHNQQIQNVPQQHNPQIQNVPQQHNQHIQNVPQQHNQQIQNVPQQHNQHIQNVPQQHNQHIQNVPQQHNQHIQNVPQQRNRKKTKPKKKSRKPAPFFSADVTSASSVSSVTKFTNINQSPIPPIKRVEPIDIINQQDDNPIFPSIEKPIDNKNDQTKLQLLIEQLEKRLADEESYRKRLLNCIKHTAKKSEELSRFPKPNMLALVMSDDPAVMEYQKALCLSDYKIHKSVADELNIAIRETQHRIDWINMVRTRAQQCLGR